MGEDGYFAFGTPLDPYDEDEVPKKKSAFQDITEQYAYDSNGKRRFHGAFTGGFSAGHWNTVSTPEGWTPQSFKSTRSERMKFDQKAEDFMDEEDRSEFGIAPREVHTTKEFSGTKRSKQKSFHEGPIPGEPVLNKLLQPAHDTAAVIILKSMGWRPGRGVGEKVTKREKKAARKLYTCYIPAEFRQNTENSKDEQVSSSEDDDDDLESQFSEILLEPDDFKPYVARPKTDTFGLGYTGLSRHSILGSKIENKKSDQEWTGSHLITNDKGRKVSIRGQAFGVGALEEEDDDIYAREDLSNYDYSLDDAKKVDSTKTEMKSFGRRVLEGFVPAKSEFKPAKIYPPPALPHDYVPNATKVRKTRFSDAVPSNSSNVPTIRDRGLGRHDLTAQDRSRILGESSNAKAQSSSDKTPNVDVSKNVEKSYEERIAAITGRNISFTSNTNEAKVSLDKKPETSSTLTDSKINELDQTPPQLANVDQSGGFKPFASNPAKQLRYEKFVVDKKENKNKVQGETSGESDRISNWEIMRELTEFEQAFRLYKPLTGAMSDRFTSAKIQEDSPVEKAKAIAHFPNESNETLEAARTGMFGKLTRKVMEWKPDSLLCKRFNVPELGVSIPQKTDKKKLSYSIFEYLEAPVHNKNTFINEQNRLSFSNDKTEDKPAPPAWKPLARTINIEPEPSKIEEKPKEVTPPIKTFIPDTEPKKGVDTIKLKRLTVAELFLQEKEKERESNAKTNTTQKLQFQKELEEAIEDIDGDKPEVIDNFNKIDLYKAIFLSDDSDSDSNENYGKGIVKEKEATNVINVTPKNVERNPSPPKGIFANLNFEKMNSWRDNQSKNNPKSDDNKKPSTANNQLNLDKHETKKPPEKVVEHKIDDVMDTYGPRLPENLQRQPSSDEVIKETDAVEINSSSDSSDWVETDKVDSQKSSKPKKSKKKKKSAKEHKSKHKTKKKHKKSKN